METNIIQLTKEQRSELSKAHFEHMIFGILWVLGGCFLTYATISTGNGRGLAFAGVILFGAVSFLRGLSGWLWYMI